MSVLAGRPRALGAVVGVWGVLCAGGWYALASYNLSAGEGWTAPAERPAAIVSTQHMEGALVEGFLHPRCPCSEATLGELAKLLSRHSELRARLWFLLPEGREASWARGARLWGIARELPRTELELDRGGERARVYGARTSGAMVLYDEGGRRVWAGGITESRGHHGDNQGAFALSEHLRGRTIPRDRFPVFGCALFDDRCSELEGCAR